MRKINLTSCFGSRSRLRAVNANQNINDKVPESCNSGRDLRSRLPRDGPPEGQDPASSGSPLKGFSGPPRRIVVFDFGKF